MNVAHILKSAQTAFIASLLIVALAMGAFFALEPTVGKANPESFTISQTITDQISFLVAPANVTMQGSIQGLTGGYATGTTVAVIRTNDSNGYSMSLHFATTTSTHAMQASSTAWINNYAVATPGIPDIYWLDSAQFGPGKFGYTVMGSTTGQISPLFMDDNSDCDAGTNESVNRCWMQPSTVPVVVIGSNGPVDYSTSTLKFKVAVPDSPSPSLPTGVYVATGILTAVNNP